MRSLTSVSAYGKQEYARAAQQLRKLSMHWEIAERGTHRPVEATIGGASRTSVCVMLCFFVSGGELRFLKFRLISRIYRPKMVRGRIMFQGSERRREGANEATHGEHVVSKVLITIERLSRPPTVWQMQARRCQHDIQLVTPSAHARPAVGNTPTEPEKGTALQRRGRIAPHRTNRPPMVCTHCVVRLVATR
jgi:hypothetical protein